MNRTHWVAMTVFGMVAPSFAPAAQVGDRPLHPRVKIVTTLGDILIEVDGERAPAPARHFLAYVQAGFYDGTIFHRVKKDSLIQAGGYLPDLSKKPAELTDPFSRRWSQKLKSKAGSVALIHGSVGSGGQTAQFFINVLDNKKIDNGRSKDRFSVFGQVIEGMDTVERIRNATLSTHPALAAGLLPVVPVKPIVMKSVRLLTSVDMAKLKVLANLAFRLPSQVLVEAVKKLEAKYGKPFKVTDSGIRYLDVQVGAGPQLLDHDSFEFHYELTLPDGLVVETTFLKGVPRTTELGGLYKGLRETLRAMHEGGERISILPPELGFPGGIPGKFPPNSTLIYRLELLSIN